MSAVQSFENHLIHVDPNARRAAFERHAAEIEAVDADDTTAKGLDTIEASKTVGQSLRRIMAQRAAVAAMTNDLELLRDFDELESAMLAAQFAYLQHLAATQAAGPIQPLVDAARTKVDLLSSAAQGLIRVNLMPADLAKKLRGGNGHDDLAVDLALLSYLYEERWSQLAGRTHITEDDWREGARLSLQLAQALQTRDERSSSIEELALRKLKSKTLFVRKYINVRAGIRFVRRHHDDADEIAPSLFAARMRRKPAADSAGDTVVTPVPPSVVPVAAVSPDGKPTVDEPITP